MTTDDVVKVLLLVMIHWMTKPSHLQHPVNYPFFLYQPTPPVPLVIVSHISSSNFYQLAARFARGRLVLRLLCGFHVCWYIYLCIHTYHVHNNYVTYIVALQPYFSRVWQFRRLLCVAAMSSLSQLRLQDGYREAEAT